MKITFIKIKNSISWDLIMLDSVDRIVLDAVDGGLSILGKEVKGAVYRFLKENH